MPAQTHPRCTHVKVGGQRCGSPTLKGKHFCYFHERLIHGVPGPVDSNISPVALIENEEAIQAALMDLIEALLRGSIENRRAELILKALYIATKNAHRVRFDVFHNEMVREVPNYAAQYEADHPDSSAPKKPPAPANGNNPGASGAVAVSEPATKGQ